MISNKISQLSNSVTTTLSEVVGDVIGSTGKSKRAFLWDQFAVADIFADAFLDVSSRNRNAPGPALNCLAQSIKLISDVLQRLIGDPVLRGNSRLVQAVQIMQNAVADSLLLGSKIPLAILEDDPEGTQKAGMVFEFLNILVSKVVGIHFFYLFL